MWIVLNPTKAHRFTTKGINLNKRSPVGYVDPGLEPEFQARIRQAITEGIIVEVAGNELTAVKIPDQGQLESVATEDTDKTINVKSIVDADGTRSTILKMPDRDGNITETKTGGSGIVMTGIYDLPLEDDEES